MKPLVSVIVPVYNVSAYIVETLDSILASTYRPLEIVLTDDGSTDDSLQVAQNYALSHPEVKVHHQANAGVSAARNHSLQCSRGTYILPVDADDKIGSTYIEHAVTLMEKDPLIAVVDSEAVMFGDKEKPWRRPAFSYSLLARKNMIPVTAMYRKSVAEAFGGYAEEDIYREDWDFWLSIFEYTSGKYVRLPEIGLYYRVHAGSRRYTAKERKHTIVDAINRRHLAFMQKYLGGPLHYHRSWSRVLNIPHYTTIRGCFDKWEEGEIIFQKRNTLRRKDGVIIKQFQTPNILKGLWYGLMGKSKARRSFEYAMKMQGLTPKPIAYKEIRCFGILRESWYACDESVCRHTFNELIGKKDFPNREKILEAIGKYTAELHLRKIIHEDYSGGNILFCEDGSHIEVIDLNRIRFRKSLSREQRLRNFERLNIDRDALKTIATAYAQKMDEDAAYDTEYIIQHRWKKHIRQHLTHLGD